MELPSLIRKLSKEHDMKDVDILAASFATQYKVPTRASKKVRYTGHAAGHSRIVSREIVGNGHLRLKLANDQTVDIRVS